MVTLSALPMNIAQQLKETSTFLPGRFQRALQNSSALERSALSLHGLRIKHSSSPFTNSLSFITLHIYETDIAKISSR
jgi:hypothetical protein